MTAHVPNVPSLACSDERTSLGSTSPQQAKKHNEMSSIDCSKKHNVMSSSDCSQKKSKKRCYSNHPQVLRPKRPRSAYNLFFKDQRNALLLDAGEELSDDEEKQSERFKVAIVTESQSSAPKPGLNQDKPKRGRGRPRGPNYKPRKKCKRRGAFSFSKLAQLIGPNWKGLEPAVKSEYQRKAVIELENYKKAMKTYNDTIARLEKVQESKESQHHVCGSLLISDSSLSVTTHTSVLPVEISNESTIGSESVASSRLTSNDEVYQPLSASLLRQLDRSTSSSHHASNKSSEGCDIDENDESYSDDVSSISDCSKSSSLSSFAINNLNQVPTKLHTSAQTSSMVLSNVNAIHKIESEHQVRVSKKMKASENTKVRLLPPSNSTCSTKKNKVLESSGHISSSSNDSNSFGSNLLRYHKEQINQLSHLLGHAHYATKSIESESTNASFYERKLPSASFLVKQNLFTS